MAWSELKYLYLPERHDVRGGEVGVLLTMDCNPGRAFVKDGAGYWQLEGTRRMEDGNFDHGWPTRTINALLRKGWLVEGGVYDERARPLRVLRSDKPGTPVR